MTLWDRPGGGPAREGVCQGAGGPGIMALAQLPLPAPSRPAAPGPSRETMSQCITKALACSVTVGDAQMKRHGDRL